MKILDAFRSPKTAVENTEVKPKNTPEPSEEFMAFGTNFREFGNANLSLPYVSDHLDYSNIWVRFGIDNLYPQVINQMYYASPINGSIINFKVNAAVGGGYKITAKSDALKDKSDAIVFDKIHKIKKLIKPSTRDIVMHECVYFRITFQDRKLKRIKLIPREWIRTNQAKSIYFISRDWSQQLEIERIGRYKGAIKDGDVLYCYEIKSVGMDVYSLPSYTSALNWCELDGKMSLAHKNNINNSIFPSFAMLFPVKPKDPRVRQELRDAVNAGKGAENMGRVITLFSQKPEWMPKLESIPINKNDSLFEQTDQRIDAQVCKAHTIDPLLMGIRVSGSLGQGNELEKAYTIFEKNTVLPIREIMEEIFNELLSIAGVNATFNVNEYKIINDTVVVEVVEDDENKKTLDAINSLSPLVATKILSEMSAEQALKLVGLKPDPNKVKETQNTPMQ